MKFISKLATALLLIALVLSIVPAATQPAKAATCYWAQFIADVTVPDGTNFAPGTAFNKTWRLKNIGTCAWSSTDVSLIFDSGQNMGTSTSYPMPTTVNPGQTVDITVPMTSPASSGQYFGYYKFKSATGVVFGIGSTANKSFWVEINVNSSTGAGYNFTANAASAAWSSGAGALSFPGTDGSANGYALTKDKPKLENGTEYTTPGLLTVPNNINNGFIQAVYPAFKVQSGDRFKATIGCEYGATSCYVAYRLDYQLGSGAIGTFWTFREKYEGMVYNVDLNLNSLAGQDVKFILVISAYGSPTGDRALWVNPIIARAGGTVATVTPPPTITGTPPTPTPTYAATPVPSACDRAQFISDVTVPDGTSFGPGVAFNKTWRLKNIGTCSWANYSIMFDTGSQMSGPSSSVIPTTVAPGQTVDITVPLVSPTTAGAFTGFWKLKSASGIPFGIGSAGTKSFWVKINVTSTSATVTPGTPPAPVTPATPISGTVYDFAANVCTATWYSGAGQQPCPGSEGNANGFVLIVNPSKLENGASDNRTGLVTVPQNITNGYIQGIYPSYKVKSGDKFRSIINCEYGATACYVVFKLEYVVAGSSTVQTFWAFVERYEGQYYAADIDLTALVGQDVKFVLSVYATGSPVGDRALWVNPIIYNASGSAPAPILTNTPVPASTNTPVPATLTFSPTPAPTNTPAPTATLTPGP